MDYSSIIGFAIFVFFSHIIAELIGRKREIGYGKTIFWCLMLSPIGGLVISLGSPRLEVEEEIEEVEPDND